MFAPTLIAAAAIQQPSPIKPEPVTTPVIIKRTFRAGSSRDYDVTCSYMTRREAPGSVPASAVVTWQGTYKITDVKSPNQAAMTVSVSNFLVDGGQPEMAVQPRPMWNVLVDEHSVITPVQPPSQTNSNSGWFIWEGITLPDKPVATGDTWPTRFPEDAALHAGEDVPVKFEGSIKYRGRPAWELSIDLKDATFSKEVSGTVPGSTEVKKIQLEGSGSMHLVEFVDQDSGECLFLNERLHTTQTAKGPGLDASPQIVDFTTTMRAKN